MNSMLTTFDQHFCVPCLNLRRLFESGYKLLPPPPPLPSFTGPTNVVDKRKEIGNLRYGNDLL